MYLGAHVSIAESIALAPERGKAVGADAIQIFSRSPRMLRNTKPIPPDAGRLRVAPPDDRRERRTRSDPRVPPERFGGRPRIETRPPRGYREGEAREGGVPFPRERGAFPGTPGLPRVPRGRCRVSEELEDAAVPRHGDERADGGAASKRQTSRSRNRVRNA